MDLEKVVLNRNLLNQILVEEGMDPYRAVRIKIEFTQSRQRSAKQIWLDILLFGGQAAGYWSEKMETAEVVVDQHKNSKELLETLAHELGHALDGAVASYIRPMLRTWRLYLILLAAGAILIFSWNPGASDNVPFINQLLSSALACTTFAYLLTSGTFLLISCRFYRRAPEERSARRWEKKLTARPDWEKVLIVGSEPEGGT